MTEDDLIFKGVSLTNLHYDKSFDLNNGRSIDFKGNYLPTNFTETNKSILLVGVVDEKSSLYYPEDGASINGYRSYFQLNGFEAGESSSEVNAFRLNFGDATSFGYLQMPASLTADAVYYDLSGRRVSGQPTEKGIYIVNGRKVVIK